MSSDRRVLIIGAVTMVVLLAIGVTGSALFTGSACADVEPEPVAAGRGAASPAGYLEGIGADLDPEVRTALASGLAELEAEFGDVRSVVDVTGADSLAPLGDDEVAAIGRRTSRISVTDALVNEAAVLDSPGRILGDGQQLFAVALINELTGQVDALAPLVDGLEAGTCVDTAVVGEPLAFYLDAGDAQVLLFRVNEDAAEPELELRDGDRGRRWSIPVTVPTAPPGILAERVTARMGPQVVVMARRLGTEPRTEEQPAVVAFDRADGGVRWELGADALADQFGDDGPLWLEPLHVDDDTALLAVARESGENRSPVGLVALDSHDGTVVWSTVLAEDPLIASEDSRLAAAVPAPGAVIVAAADGGETRVMALGPTSGERLDVFEPMAGGMPSLAVRDDGSVIVVTGGPSVGVVSPTGGGMARTQFPVGVVDVVTQGPAITALIELPADAATAITFG